MTQQTKNIHPSEIDQFDSQAAFWWDLEGPFKTLHQINPVRLKYMLGFTRLADKKVLDVGCGGGILAEAMAVEKARVTGLDMSDESLKTAKLHLFESGLEVQYLKQTIEEFAEQQSEQFDVVTCLEMLEHVPDPESIIKACLQTLKPGGWLFLSTINRNAKAMMLGILAAEHILKIVPKGTHHYEQFIKPSELVRTLNKHKVNIVDISGMRYNPFTSTATLDKTDVDINYFVAICKQQ